MSKGRLSLNLNSMICLFLTISIFASCVSELPEVESENIQETVFDLTSFSGSTKVKLETILEKNSLEKHDLAKTSSQLKTVKINFIAGNTSLRPLLNDMVLTVPKSLNETIEIQFNIHDSHLVAKTNLPTSIDKNQYASAENLYLFQYPIASYGIKRRQKNQNNEETRNIEFHQTEKFEATHVKINNPFLDNVEFGGIGAFSKSEQKKILLKDHLEKTIWKSKDLVNLFNVQEQFFSFNNLEKIGLELKTEEKYSILLTKNYLYIQEIISFNDLSEQEKANIDISRESVALHQCRDEIKKESGIENCYSRSLYKTIIDPIIIRPSKDQKGNELATVILDHSSELTSVIHLTQIKFEDVKNDRNKLLVDTENRIVINKKDIDFESEYLYVPSTHGTPRDVVNAAPFFQGEEKIVKLKMQENGLLVYEEDNDIRFQQNQHNQSPVLMIQGEHISSQCQDKVSGNICAELENKTSKWNEKQYFAPNLDKFIQLQTNEVDLFTLNNSCFQEVASKLTHSEIKNGVINVEQIKTYKVLKNSNCMINLYFSDNLKSSSFTVKHFYSLIRLKDLESPDYVKFNYPIENHSKFGFFKDALKTQGQDFTKSRERTHFLLNRFNPKKENINYNLSIEFGRPENKYILDATHNVVNKLNESLKKANAGIQLSLSEPKSIFPGDLRQNSIVLITDPLANGLLGYGPSVSNPRTGEILQAHTNMYLGVLRTTTRRVYKQLEKMSVQQPILNESEHSEISSLVEKQFPNKLQEENLKIAKEKLGREINRANIISNSKNIFRPELLRKNTHHHSQIILSENKNSKVSPNDIANLISKDNDNHTGETTDISIEKLASNDSLYEKTLNFYAFKNAFHENALDHLSLGKVIIPELKKIDGIVKENGFLVSWEDLNSVQKEEAIKVIITQAYTTTLAHELGHNLGLRHNFKGSFDKNNFYSSEELPEESQHLHPKYSSIMDYGASQLNELPILGKYDIAALRYGYANEVELSNGKFQKVSGDTILQSINSKKYLYCTDENAGGSLECNRFDEGTTLVEIVQHYIHTYKNSYQSVNLRDEREQFSAFNLPSYINYKAFLMREIRSVLSRYFWYLNTFGSTAMNGACPEDKFPLCVELNDTYRATKLAGDFFLEVISMPDKTCAIFKNNEIDFRSFEELSYGIQDLSKVTSCFHQEILDRLEPSEIMLAEVGLPLNDLSGRHELIRSSLDIDVQGYWVDKLIAIHMLFGRTSSSSMENPGLSPISFTDHPEFRSKLYEYVSHITLGTDLTTLVPFVDINGKEITVPYSLDQINYIPMQPTWYPTYAFNFPPFSGANLNELILNLVILTNDNTDPMLADAVEVIKNTLSVRKQNSLDEIAEKNQHIQIGPNIYSAGNNNTIAKNMIEAIHASTTLSDISPEMAGEVLKLKLNPPAPNEYSLDDLKIYNAEMDVINAVINILSAPIPRMTLEEINQIMGDMEISEIIFAGQKIGLDRAKAIKEEKIKRLKSKTECLESGIILEDLSDEEIKLTCDQFDLLWGQSIDVLILKSENQLDEKAKDFKQKIKILPKL